MIRFANDNDTARIMAFIESDWKHGHILARDKSFFLYEHGWKDGRINFVLSEENGAINGILGFIPYGETNRDVMTVVWKARDDAPPATGLALLQYLKENGDVRIMASPGSAKKLKGMYRYLGYEFGRMTQWYRLHAQSSYTLASVNDNTVPACAEEGNALRMETWEDVERHFDFEAYTKNKKPYKEAWYIKKRYFDHPAYRYEVYGVKEQTNPRYPLLLVFRLEESQGARALRLVDCIGKCGLLAHATSLVDGLLEQHKAEYADCYEAGVEEAVFEDAGWRKVQASGNVIPNYFSPFVRENIDIWYFSTDSEIVLFKGDGDQDRPS